MAHFTQLNLQGNAGGKPSPATGPSNTGKTSANGKPAKKQHGTAKIVAITGSLVAAALVTTLTLGTNGCSKSGKPAIAAPSSPMASMPQAAPVPTPMAATTVAPAATKPVKKTLRRRTFTTYKNADYGISFRYPRTYSLAKDDQANLEWTGLGPVEMNFVQPGGATLAAVQLPKKMYPGTNFVSAFFNVAVNSKLTAKECAQFAFEDGKQPAIATGNEANQAVEEPTKVKLGAAEYTEVESTGGESAKHADAKYYHVFQNGACYEFALGLETQDGKADVKPVDATAVFGKLNWMLSTVKIESAGIPAKATPAVASAPDTPAIATVPAPSSKLTESPAPTTTAAVEGGKN